MFSLSDNAFDSIAGDLVSSQQTQQELNTEIEDIRQKLVEAASVMNFALVNELQKKVESITTSQTNNRIINNETIIPKPPDYFKMAKVEGIDHSQSTIHLKVKSNSYPTAVSGDNCATNLKAYRLTSERY